MKKLKQIITQIKSEAPTTPDEFNSLIWQLICYPPKMQVRLQQEQFLNEADKFNLKVNDKYFTKKELNVSGFIWGNGLRKVLITHGWGSKAADFSDVVTELLNINNLQVIAFDAPGNGSSGGDLSNLLLYVDTIKAIILKYGKPDILIGHSLGAMANIIALKEMKFTPTLLISLSPLIRLKENFEQSMFTAGVSQLAQDIFLKSFQDKFKMSASNYNLSNYYIFDSPLNHWLAYDRNDQVSPYDYVEDFLLTHSSVKSKNYENSGHERIIKLPQAINDLVNIIKEALMNTKPVSKV